MKINPTPKKDYAKIGLIAALATLAALFVIPYIQIEIDLAVIGLIWVAAIAIMGASATEKKFTTLDIEGDHITLIKGIISKKTVVISYEKITDIYVTRDFIDVLVGTGSIHINTAGTAYMELSALDLEAKYLDQLVDMMKIKKKKSSDDSGY